MTRMDTDKKLLFKEETFKIIGACFDVYNEMGCGFLEPVYQECLEIEFEKQRIPFDPQKNLELNYKGRKLNHTYQPDFICFDKIIKAWIWYIYNFIHSVFNNFFDTCESDDS